MEEVPISSVGPLLSQMLFLQVCLSEGHGPEQIAHAFKDDDDDAMRCRSAVLAAINLFRGPLMQGRFTTYARPFGGGSVTVMKPSDWEVDDLLPRFATCSYDPSNPFDANAEPTAWIFADASIETAILELHRSEYVSASNQADYEESSAHEQQTSPETFASERSTGTSEGKVFLRRGEVERMTGLRKSSIYERIRDDRFPKPEPIGKGRVVGWRFRDIEKWLDDPQ
ncbi:AlpA family transcriptional regulator [Qipengyuania sp. GH25]|uniref:AlpA family transcriptional regulator n=1 Tax=Qipengyuania pacifica TaxID=2860199 RepID=A0ABS7JK31_9SPHN|nr:AlpA family phage regulatory protein [Qipengyuania aerophila]MBX7489755.1 AlpA family transcriptional regulator [Qipengyuania aerophila]